MDFPKPSRLKFTLRSEQKRFKLEVPQAKCKTYRDTAFGVYLAKTWNDLPDNVREIQSTPVQEPPLIYLS